MRGRMFNMPAIGRAAGCALVAAAIIAAAVQFNRHSAPRPAASPVAHPGNPLAAALARCQTLGTTAQIDAACQAAWAERSRRFFNDTPLRGGR